MARPKVKTEPETKYSFMLPNSLKNKMDTRIAEKSFERGKVIPAVKYLIELINEDCKNVKTK